VLEPLQATYYRLLEDSAYLNKIISEGAKKAAATAHVTLEDVYKKVGFNSFRL